MSQWRPNKGGSRCSDWFNKTDFLFSCKIHSWSLHLRHSDIGEVNIARSDTPKHSLWAKFGAKIVARFWDIVIFVLGCFFLNHPVGLYKSQKLITKKTDECGRSVSYAAMKQENT